MQQQFDVNIIGERINPGFKSTRAFFDNRELSSIQNLAVKQAEAGARYLNINVGAEAQTDSAWMAQVIHAIQDVVTLPLSFDFPSKAVQEVCLGNYNVDRAGGELPIVNSITEHRWNLMELFEHHLFKVIVLISERVDDGIAKNNKTATDLHATAHRAVDRLCKEYGIPADHIFLDISVSAIVADTEGLTRNTLDAIRMIRDDPDLAGVHMMCGLSNIGQQLPAKAADGSDLKLGLENAFLTLAVPDGLDYVLGTPWREYRPLTEDDHVFATFRHFLEQRGSNALRAVRKLYRA
jgi:5-methyltetrahydrofolate--homocysteine methyltransferase